MANVYCAPAFQSTASIGAALPVSDGADQNFQFGPNVTSLGLVLASTVNRSSWNTENIACPLARNRSAAPSRPPARSANVAATRGALPSAGISNTQVAG